MPSQTNNHIQVRNLDERKKIPEVIDALKETFGEFGNIVEVIAKKSVKRKGQAFIVYESAEEAGDALEALQGFDVLGRPVQLAFAKTRSDTTVLKEEGEEGLEKHKKHRLAEKGEIGLGASFYVPVMLTYCRAQASCRSRRRRYETRQTRCGRWPRRATCQNFQGLRCGRRIPASEQGPYPARTSTRLHQRADSSCLCTLSRIQGNPYGAWSRGSCLCRV